jgi:hemoglobin-like flavoprotein
MGSTKSKVIANDDNIMYENNIIKLQNELNKKISIPLEIQVAHYTPSIFPLIPIINKKTNKLCIDSWNKIINRNDDDASGITLFYTEFYNRLEKVDENKKIESILSSHAVGVNKIVEKGSIIIRIINYALALESNNEMIQYKLLMLGKAHSKRNIKPYMYSIFIQTLLYTIADQLGNDATHDVMEAWVNLFAFIMKSMLPPAIDGQVIETEININTKTEFASDKITNEIIIKDEEEQYKKNIIKMSRGGTPISARSAVSNYDINTRRNPVSLNLIEAANKINTYHKLQNDLTE